MYEKESKADDYYYEAMEASTLKKRKELLKLALETYPDHIDAQLVLIKMERGIFKSLDQIVQLEVLAQQQLVDQNLWGDETMGHFWAIIETRPYMRVLYNKLDLLKMATFYYEAIAVAQNMLMLCESDNLGVRLVLADLFAKTQNQSALVALLKKFDVQYQAEFAIQEISVYLGQGQENKAMIVAKKTDKNDPGFINFFADIDDEKQNSARKIAANPRYMADELFFNLLDHHAQIIKDQDLATFFKKCKVAK